MKYLLFTSTFLLLIAFSEVDAASSNTSLSCFNCIYNISLGAPVHNPRCGDPFDGDMIGTETCEANKVCAKYPAFLGDNTGEFMVSLERKCGVDTGNGCIKFSDAKGGYLKICGYFCKDGNNCNGTGALGIDIMVLLMTMVFALLLVLL